MRNKHSAKLVAWAVLGISIAIAGGAGGAVAPPATVQPSWSRAEAMAELRDHIKGRENDPAKSVFVNLEVLGEVPAGNLLKIMERGFSNSLGVECSHCHNTKRWESDELDQKLVARDMFRMVQQINGELLPSIAGLEDRQPTVNCTTCHRGDKKPALNLDQ